MGSVVVREGTVAELHRLDPVGAGPVEPQVWWCRPTDAAVVLGSRQAASLLDPVACEAAGLATVRRRSGGGAVLIRPDSVIWIDVVLPHGIVPNDVRGSMERIGEIWLAALGDAASGCVVHRGGMVDTAWSDLVCFAGAGPGEIVHDVAIQPGEAPAVRKLVGLSQRRTRHGIRVQGLVHTAPLTHEISGLFATGVPEIPLGEPVLLATPGAVMADQIASRITTM